MVRWHFIAAGCIALAGMAGTAFAQAPVSNNAPAPKVNWAPDAIPSVINPTPQLTENAWASFRNSPTKPSVDQKLEDPVLKGAIDIHAHYGPDVYNRQWDPFEIARIAKARGMRGIVIKSHWTESATLAEMTRKYATPDLEVFGGLSLNTTVGGINPMAVRMFAEIAGHRAKVVWMPTHDAENEVLTLKQSRPFVRVSKDGKLLPQVGEVLDLIAKYKLTLATGHVRADEMLAIVREAKKRGIEHVIITHPGLGPQYTDPTIDQLKEAVAMGGYAEVVANELYGAARAKKIELIKAVGPEHVIISTDSGLVGTPNHADALVLSARILREAGFTEPQLDMMFKRNPALVLGLPPL
jgi:hypothetical protein